MQATTFNTTVAHATSALPMLSTDGAATARIIQNLQASDAAVARATNAWGNDATIVSPSGQAITAFHQRLYDVAFECAQELSEAFDNQQLRLKTVLAHQYGDTCPTYKQFQADRAALKTLAAYKGLVDDQWLRKPYNLAIKSLYGALPVAMTEAAIAKRAARATQPKIIKAAVGAPAGQPAPRNSSVSEQVEQMVAKFGVFATMKAITAILKADAKSATDAAALDAIAAHYKAG